MFGFLRRNKLSLQDVVTGASDGSVILIDVREASEVAASGKAAGALHIPLNRLHEVADPSHQNFDKALNMQRKTAIYCASGARSVSAVRILRQLGYDDVHNIGGLGHWVKAGGALEAL